VADEEERALVRQLEELQREERVAQLKRKVDEWKARREAGYPDDLANPLGATADVDTTHSERRGSAASTSVRRGREEEEDDDHQSIGSADRAHKRHQRDYHLRAPDPVRYTARSYREYTAFVRACEQCFEAKPRAYRTDDARALFVKIWSEGEAQDAIYRRLESADGTPTWDELKSFLQGLLAPEAQRTQDAARAYYAAKQRKDQSVNAFVTYVEGLEKSLPEVPEANRVTHLKQALRSDIAVEVLTSPNQPTTRQALIEAAQRAEQIKGMRERANREERLPFRSGPSDPTARPRHSTSSPITAPRPEQAPRRWVAGNPQVRPPSSVNYTPVTPRTTNPNTPGASGARDKSKDTCRHCGKLGHWEKDCWKKNGGKPGPAKA
jgi:hypothetical protein